MYKYFSYDDLPEFIIIDLNQNPRLLSRSAASDIKRLLNKHKDSPFINDCLKEAWSLLLIKELEQTKIKEFITRKLQSLQTETDFLVQSSHNLIKDGKKVGSMSWTSKHLTVRLNNLIVDEEKEQKLRDFLAKLIDGGLVKV
jgi:ParB family chromosome partitioning protein